MKRRVVVTGIGMVTPVGLDTETSWEGLVNGRSGIGPITQFDDKTIPTQIAGEIHGFEPEKYIEPKEIKKMDRFIHLAIAASQMAVDASGLAITPENADRIGVIDEAGTVLWGDQLMVLFSRDILGDRPGATFVSEVKCSQTMYDDIRSRGGKAIMWKTGHSLIKAKMKEAGAALAGEMSGHLFFAHRYFGFDDAIYASGRLLEILASSGKTIRELLADVQAQHLRHVRQRAAKRQPSGGWAMSGTRPSIDGRLSRFWSSLGIEPSRPTVYGCSGRANSASTGALSTIWPAYIRAMRCATCDTIPRSCVIRMMAVSIFERRSRMRSRI